MGTIKTTNIEPIADNGTITLGSSGDTFTVPSGVIMSGQNYPAFNAYRSSDGSSWSVDTFTKVTFNAETLDTNNNYDVSNGRFTPTVAGNYFCYYFLRISYNSGTAADIRGKFNFNGSDITAATNAIFKDYSSSGITLVYSLGQSTTINFNGSSDYLEIYGRSNASGGGFAGSGSYFGAYRIGS